MLFLSLFLKYPLSLNLETDGKQDSINDTFPYGSGENKGQCLVHQNRGNDQLADAENIVFYHDGDFL